MNNLPKYYCATVLVRVKPSTRVVSSDISLGKFPEIYSNLSGNLLNIFSLNNFLIITIEKNYKMSMFLTDNSPDLCVLTLCIKIRQNNLYWASLPRISANSNENYRHYNFQASAEISGNIKFPENLQPYHRPLDSKFMLYQPWQCWVRYFLKVFKIQV